MKNGPLKGGGSCKYMPVIMQRFTHRKKKEVLYLLKKKETNKQERKKQEQRNIMDINCEVLLQEFNKHLYFSFITKL